MRDGSQGAFRVTVRAWVGVNTHISVWYQMVHAGYPILPAVSEVGKGVLRGMRAPMPVLKPLCLRVRFRKPRVRNRVRVR